MTNEELVEQVQQGVNISQNMGVLYEQNYNYIRFLILPYSKNFGQAGRNGTTIFEIDDLMGEAYFSLKKAIEKYDRDTGVKFMSFASKFIKLDAKRFVESMCSLVHIPVDKTNLMWRYNTLLRQHPSETDDFFANELNISLYRLGGLKKMIDTTSTLSMDYRSDESDSDSSLYNMLAENLTAEEIVIQEMSETKLNDIWDEAEKVCTEKEMLVIQEHYIKNLSFQKIGNQIGKCAEIARRHHTKALDKLKTDPKIAEIAEWYFDDYSQVAFRYGVKRFEDTRTSSTEYIAIKRVMYEYWLTDGGISQIVSWRKSGFNRGEIAKKMGITRKTLNLWCKQFTQIAEAMNNIPIVTKERATKILGAVSR